MKVWVYYVLGLWLVSRAFSLLVEENEKDVTKAMQDGYRNGFDVARIGFLPTKDANGDSVYR